MDVSCCKRCGRIFNSTGSQYCPKCVVEQDDEFAKVKEYIRDNPGCTAPEVAKACDVKEKQILTWVREERLSFTTAEGSGIFCEQCGKAISSGRYCDVCKVNIKTMFQEVLPHDYKVHSVEKKKQNGNKMRFLNKE